MSNKQERSPSPSLSSHFIGAWLRSKRFFLKSPLYMACEDHVWQDFWVGLDSSVMLHEAAEFPLIPFEKARTDCFTYLENACGILGKGKPGWSPSKEASAEVTERLGSPPFNAYTIYLITTSTQENNDETVVYVGKTNSQSHRFRGGHAAISKLHAPEYEGMQKRVYFGCLIGINDDDNYVPIDWLVEENGRDKVLANIEHQLIFNLQPALNSEGKGKCLAEVRVPVHVQNLTDSGLRDFHFDEDQRIALE